jgi:hypothetical protein
MIEDILDTEGRRFLVAISRSEDPGRDQYLHLMLMRVVARELGWGHAGALSCAYGADLQVFGEASDADAKRVRITVSFEADGISLHSLLTFRARDRVAEQDGAIVERAGEQEIGAFLNVDLHLVEARVEGRPSPSVRDVWPRKARQSADPG